MISGLLKSIKPANADHLQDLAFQVLYATPRQRVSKYRSFHSYPGAKSVVILLPGSFLDNYYLKDLAEGISSVVPSDLDIVGINYPCRGKNYRQETIDDLTLVDYVHSAYYLIRDISRGYENVYLVGHSLGTIIVQLLLWVLTAAKDDPALSSFTPAKVFILGGGPPKLGLLDYIATLTTRANTMKTVMQMVNDPDRFISPEGDMSMTLDSEVLDDLRNKGFIYRESKAVMKQAFFSNDLAFIPHPLLDHLRVECEFIYAENDFFVADRSSHKAITQWGGASYEISAGHSGLVTGETGFSVGQHIAQSLTR